MAWTDMAEGSYDIYIMASDGNPFDTANLGTINKYSFTSEVPKWEFLLKTVKISALLLLLCMIFLFFISN